MLATIGAALASEALQAFFSALFTTLFGFLEKREQDRRNVDLGRAEHTVIVNKESADAERRAAQAGIDAPSGAQLDDDLVSGRRGF